MAFHQMIVPASTARELGQDVDSMALTIIPGLFPKDIDGAGGRAWVLMDPKLVSDEWPRGHSDGPRDQWPVVLRIARIIDPFEQGA